MQLSEKSESTSLRLQGLGAAGIPSLLISQPVLYSFLPYREFCLGGNFQVDVSCVCSLTKLTCSTQIQTVAFLLQSKSWVMVIKHHEDVWLLTGTLCVALSILFWLFCSTWGMIRSHTVGPRFALLVNYLSAQWSGSAAWALRLEHSPSQHCHLDLEGFFQGSGQIPYVLITQKLCIQGEV